jgi:polyisoprenoid-binding protein YceI
MSEPSDGMGILAQADVAVLVADGAAAGRWVLDPAGSRAQFHVKHFWGAVTVPARSARLPARARSARTARSRAG